jgi:hypothetical protein
MTIEAAILKNVEKPPDAIKQAVLLYTEFLASQYVKENSEETVKKPENHRLSGLIKETFVLPLPHDYDETLELTNSASKSAYEKKYGYGSLAGKIFMSDDFDEPLEELKDYM